MLLVYFLFLQNCLKELTLFNYFQENTIFTPSQSGVLPGDSFIPQLLSIIHEIQTAFDENPTVDVRGVILDISKTFDRV